MVPIERRLIALGEEVARAQEVSGLGPESLARGRARLLHVTAPRSRGRVRTAAVGLALAAAVTTAVAITPRRRPTALGFHLGTGARGEVGAWIAAPPTAPLPVVFSDASSLTVLPGARARVTQLGADGGDLVVERGTIELAVVHRDEHTRWNVAVGPFDVRVTGTRFAVAWDPEAERFTLTMMEGSVIVTGPGVADGRRVIAGEMLRLAGGAEPAAPEPIQPLTTGTAEDVRPDAGVPRDAGPSAPVVGMIRHAARQAGGAPDAPEVERGADDDDRSSWRSLAAAGKYREALEGALPRFDAMCAHAPEADLAMLADTARLAGDATHARAALLALRARFAHGARAVQAAFFLGRIDASAGDARGASEWFESYVREAPDGPLVLEAWGRLVETARSREVARRYLDRWPGGPRAALARSILDGAGETP